MVLTSVSKIELKEVEKLTNTNRGKGGFGSTG
jgi:dUTPase